MYMNCNHTVLLQRLRCLQIDFEIHLLEFLLNAHFPSTVFDFQS